MRSTKIDIIQGRAEEKFRDWAGERAKILHVSEFVSMVVVTYILNGRIHVVRLFPIGERWEVSCEAEFGIRELIKINDMDGEHYETMIEGAI